MTEIEVRTRFITPALSNAGWPLDKMRKEFFYFFTDGRIEVRWDKPRRREPKRVDYLLEYRPNLPLAIVEAKDNAHPGGEGI